ncbi:hypothetical protein [uncultured Sphingomonas sp.]|uniref:hypothetical protein n=1 Tax=uncultured Sphingomonas sp. TaxID=158754 RepID=UPI002631ABB9|nr:hypothetical protein [uncultured Sphingomonas sp.]
MVDTPPFKRLHPAATPRRDAAVEGRLASAGRLAVMAEEVEILERLLGQQIRELFDEP